MHVEVKTNLWNQLFLILRRFWGLNSVINVWWQPHCTFTTEHLLTDPGNSLIMTPNLSIFHLLTVMKSLRDDLYDRGDVYKTYHNKLTYNMNIICQPELQQIIPKFLTLRLLIISLKYEKLK